MKRCYPDALFISAIALSVLIAAGFSKSGAQGPRGLQGNANVQSDTFSVTSSQWQWNSSYEFQTSPSSYTEYFTRYYDASFSQITDSILNSGEVMVYFTPNTSNNMDQWVPLPYQFTDGSGNFSYNVAFETMTGKVRLHYFFVQTNPSATIPLLQTYTIATYKFKIVAVSGAISASLHQAHIDLRNYDSASKYVGF